MKLASHPGNFTLHVTNFPGRKVREQIYQLAALSWLAGWSVWLNRQLEILLICRR